MKIRFSSFILLVVSLALSAHGAETAGQPQADKSQYTLFNPTPAKLMREMSTDRPDKTECPFTVDAGHVQIELDMAVYGYERDTADGANIRATSWSVVPVNVKIGLNNWSDLQLIIDPADQVRVEDRSTNPSTVTHVSGFGDITVRYKVNFWGNDGGNSALGLLPFIKFPTNQHGLGNNAVEGGVILPYNCQIGGGWELGMQTELDAAKNDGRDGYHVDFINSLTAGHDIVGALGGYAEIFSQHSSRGNGNWLGTLDFGLTYAVTGNVQLDAGTNIGISRAAPAVEFFTGLSLRF